MNKYDRAAAEFCEAIKEIAGKPENLENLEAYLSHHFLSWLKNYASTPDGLAAEMRNFSET